MEYNITEENGKQVLNCAMTETERMGFIKSIWDEMNQGGFKSFINVCEWCGEPIRFNEDNPTSITKLQRFVKFFNIEGVDVYKETIIRTKENK